MSIQTITNEITAPITVARDAYQLALANGFVGTLDEWLNQQNTALGFAEAAEASATAAAISADEAADASRLEIGTVTTSAPGADGSVSITGDPGEQVLDFIVPRGPQGEVGLTGATGAQGPIGLTGAQGIQGIQGIQGVQGIQGIQADKGDQGDRAGLKYSFDTNTSPGAPNQGQLKFNSSTLSAVTRISIRDTDFNGTDISALLALIDDSTSAIKARVVIRSNSNADTSHFNFLVTSVTDDGNHYDINGTYVSGSSFSNNEVVTFDFYATGDKGDQGDQGIQGVGPVTIADAAPVSPTDGMLWMGLANEVLSIYSTTKARWIVPIVRGLDPDAEAVIYALTQQSATVTAAQTSAIDSFFRTGKIQGWYKQLRRLYLPIWGSHGPNAIDWIGLGSGAFQGTVTPGAGFVKGDKQSGCFDFGIAPSAAGLLATSGMIGFLSQANRSNPQIADTSIGCENSTTQRARINSVILTDFYTNAQRVSLGSNIVGIYTASRTASNLVQMRRRITSGVTGAQNTNESTGTVPTANMFAMANNAAGTISGYCDAEYGSFFMGMGMGSDSADNFTLALKNLWENLTGLTLP